MLKVYVPREVFEGETRVAATPETVRHYLKAGLEVHVESGAGIASGIPDADYEAAGAKLSADAKALFERHQFHLPPFAFWTPDDWARAGHEADEIRACLLGPPEEDDNRVRGGRRRKVVSSMGCYTAMHWQGTFLAIRRKSPRRTRPGPTS